MTQTQEQLFSFHNNRFTCPQCTFSQ